MRKGIVALSACALVLSLAGWACAEVTDYGEITFALVPTTTGENTYTYTLELVDMGNNHFSVNGKATYFKACPSTRDSVDLKAPSVPGLDPVIDPGLIGLGVTHTKVVHGNAELVGTQAIFNLNETFAGEPACPGVAFIPVSEMHAADVRVVLTGDLTSGTFTAIRHSFTKDILMGSPWVETATVIIEGTVDLTP